MTDPQEHIKPEDLEYGNWPIHFIDEVEVFWWAPYALAAFTGIVAIATLCLGWLVLIGPR